MRFEFVADKKRRLELRNIVSGLFAVAWLVVALPMAATAGEGTVAYKPGALKAAIERGETVLVDYKALW